MEMLLPELKTEEYVLKLLNVFTGKIAFMS